jgi:ferredoxin/flavodoxin---NADP+ reductase
LGPLGRPARIEKKEAVICIATGMGIAQILPVCRAFKNTGTKVVGIIGAKTKRALMLEPQMRLACSKIFIATDDGSYERRGLATDILKEFIEKQDAGNAATEGSPKDLRCLLVYAIGSVEMMRTVCRMTKERGIKTLVKLNPVMVDCMGMCGSCRVKVGGKMVLACVEGPEFDGHKVDFNDLDIRMNAYKEPEGWGSRQLKHRPGRSGSGILTKFLSGILKS